MFFRDLDFYFLKRLSFKAFFEALKHSNKQYLLTNEIKNNFGNSMKSSASREKKEIILLLL